MKINLTITRNGIKEQLQFELPVMWSQVKFRDNIGLIDCKNDIQVIALFTGIDEELIKDSKIHNLNEVIACLTFLKKTPEYALPITISGYKIAKDLNTESIAQYTDLQDILKGLKQDDLKHNYSLFPLIVATYAIDPYDFTKAEEIKDQFLNAPCTEVLAVANFTLVKWDALRRGIVPTCPPAATLLNRLRQDMKDWLSNLDTSIRFYLWKRSLPLSERNFLNGR